MFQSRNRGSFLIKNLVRLHHQPMQHGEFQSRNRGSFLIKQPTFKMRLMSKASFNLVIEVLFLSRLSTMDVYVGFFAFQSRNRGSFLIKKNEREQLVHASITEFQSRNRGSFLIKKDLNACRCFSFEFQSRNRGSFLIKNFSANMSGTLTKCFNLVIEVLFLSRPHTGDSPLSQHKFQSRNRGSFLIKPSHDFFTSSIKEFQSRNRGSFLIKGNA